MLFLFYFVLMIRKICTILSIAAILCIKAKAQNDNGLFVKDALKENRAKQYQNLVTNSITKNLSLPLTDSTEENWQDAFFAMELISYRSPWTDEQVRKGLDSVEKRSAGFQRSVLELLYTLKIRDFRAEISDLLRKTPDSKIFSMCAEYLLLLDHSTDVADKIHRLAIEKNRLPDDEKSSAILTSLINRTGSTRSGTNPFRSIQKIFAADYLKGNIIVYSIQRKDRNYPGIVIIKDRNGDYIKDDRGKIFFVPQLARSITNLPGYLTNGNTPEGFFRMHGFDVSKSMAIGPTPNIQLLMPGETAVQVFFNNSALADIPWTKELYKIILPESLKDYQPLYESFYAGMAGRTEIIAHGTTVNPEYYKNQPYYPLTPTQGCLCTKEIWSTVDGKRIESDQQKLIDALIKAGGADGYVVVIELDDQQKPVTINDILPYLK